MNKISASGTLVRTLFFSLNYIQLYEGKCCLYTLSPDLLPPSLHLLSIAPQLVLLLLLPLGLLPLPPRLLPLVLLHPLLVLRLRSPEPVVTAAEMHVT